MNQFKKKTYTQPFTQNDHHGNSPSSTSFFDKLKWMTSRQAAFYLQTSVGQLRNMVWRKQLRVFKFGARLRFLKTDLDLLLKPAY